MKKSILFAILLPLLAFGQDFYGDIRGESGKFETVTVDGKPALKLSGITKRQDSTVYFIGSIYFAQPLNLTGKQVRFKVTTPDPKSVIALAVRFYNQDEKDPCWSFMGWGNVFSGRNEIYPELFPLQSKILPWQSNMVNGKPPARVHRIRFWLGSTTPDTAIEAVFSDFAIDEAPAPRPAVAPYADAPASVRHPAGSIKQEDVERARQNIARHPWAAEELEKLKKQADEWMRLKPEEIADWISTDDAWFKCLCPNCGTQPEFAWAGKSVLQPDGKSIRCTNCKMVFPNDQYPEDRTYQAKTPRGKWKTIKYHHGKDQMAQGENYGPKYHISGAVNYVKQQNLRYVYPVAAVYAITGDKAYAQRVRDILLRFAEVYPDYVYKYRATAYESPEQNKMAGKLCDWKLHDSYRLSSLLDAYSLTYNSGVYSDADKLAIENGICREFKHLITAFPPTADYCLNAVPSHMAAAAACAAVLGDHDLINWVLESPEGLKSFLERYYHRDGLWYENSAAYGNMATDPFVPLVGVLQGYSDAPAYDKPDRYDHLDLFRAIPLLEKIFTAMAPATLPTGALPAFNDSSLQNRQSVRQLELTASLQPTPAHLSLLRWFTGQASTPWALNYSLFKRDPSVGVLGADRGAPPPELTRSVILPGAGWAVLRRPDTFSDSALALTYGKHASHSHNSMLNYLYCDFGREVISDLGYLSWWHDNRLWLTAPLSHNLVIVDKQTQSNHRVATPELFAGNGGILAMRFNAPSCYPGKTSEYARTMFTLPLSGGRQYLVDFFSVKGGSEHLWTFHADGEGFTPPAGAAFTPADTTEVGGKELGANWLKNLRKGTIPAGTAVFRWQFDKETETVLYRLSSRPGTIFLADAPGLRDQSTPYADIKLNLVLEQRGGPENVFATVLECHQGAPLIESASLLETGGRPATAVQVTTKSGTDLIVLAEPGAGTVTLSGYPTFRMDARSGVVRLNADGKPVTLWSEGRLAYGAATLDAPAPVRGGILAVNGHELTTDLTAVPDLEWSGNYLNASAHHDGMYRMQSAALKSGKLVITLNSTEIVRLKSGDSFTIQPYLEKNY